MSKTPKHRAAVPAPVSAAYDPDTAAAVRAAAGDDKAVQAVLGDGGERRSPKAARRAADKAATSKTAKED